MKRSTALVLLLLAVGCASGGAGAPPQTTADTRLTELQTAMTELLERLDVINDRLARLETERDDAPARSATSAPLPAPSSPRATTTTQRLEPAPAARRSTNPMRAAELAEHYRQAILHYGARRVTEARAGFQRVFDADPSSELADNALFWIGETYFSAGDYPNAISFYRRVAQQYGDQNKAPDAVYKLALAYVRTGDLALARQTLQDVIARYPYSSSAASARAELERIKY